MKKVLQLLLFLIFNFLAAQEGTYEILNTSINSKFAELGVTYSSNNSVIFASSKKDNGGKRATNRQLYLELYHGMITDNGDIIQTNKFSSEINNKFFESDIAFTPDFKTIYFTWNNFYNTQTRKDSAKWKTLYMFKASVNQNFEISNVTPLTFNSKEYSVRSPAVSADGKKLYFVSDMPGGYGELDIYVVDINNEGNYGVPKNLGPIVNTKQTELFPYIDQNNTLYFSSNGYKGLGGLDIFKSEFINGNFQQAVNLPPPFNSKYDDFALVIDATNSGYFTSNRAGGKGDVDIYAFKEKCIQTINILTLNDANDQPLDQVQVFLFLNNQLVEKQTVSKGSGYKFNINCKETYKIIAEKENYKTAELTIATDDKNKTEITKTLKLTSIECKQLLSGNILDGKTNLPLDQVQVSFFQNNKLVEKQSISKGSNFKFNINCKETYKLVAEKENYETVELSVSSNDKNKTEITKTLKLTPIECTQLLSGNITDSKTNLPLDQVSVSLFQNNQLVEKQTISKNSNFKFNVDCKETYKLVAEKENYETVELSITTDDKNKTETRKTLKLTPIECIQMLNGIVTDSETNLPLPNAVVHIYKGKELLAKINLDDNAAFTYKLECEMPYRFTVSLKNYHDLVSTIKTTDKTNEVNNIQLQMESSIEFVEVREQKMIKTKAINFDLDQSSIRLDAAIELNKVIAILRKYPKLKIEIKSHTDSRAAAEYNMKLTNDRAKKVMDYLIANGIDSSRVSGRGYGETQLLNNCAKGVKCSEEEHQMNRRTEFIITDE
ncbi:MAG: OmpA family protein [Lutibacter sp.]|nr:OmpA family protein [Lutibacter sp.]